MKDYRFTWVLKSGGFMAATVQAASPAEAIIKGKQQIRKDVRGWRTGSSFWPNNYKVTEE